MPYREPWGYEQFNFLLLLLLEHRKGVIAMVIMNMIMVIIKIIKTRSHGSQFSLSSQLWHNLLKSPAP